MIACEGRGCPHATDALRDAKRAARPRLQRYEQKNEQRGSPSTVGQVQTADKLYMESNLLRVAGALSCSRPESCAKNANGRDRTRCRCRRQTHRHPSRSETRTAGPLAHKIFVALIKKHSDYGRPIRKEIDFTRREIGRLTGRKEWGGRDSEQLSRAIDEIHNVFVNAFQNPGGKFVEIRFEFSAHPHRARELRLTR